MKINMPKSRLTAFISHLVFSIVIFIGLAAVIYFAWYPNGLFGIAGGINGIKIVAGVDLVLGPVLMLVVYNVAKPAKKLLIDVAVVIGFQLVCLGIGVFLIYQERPVAVTFAYDRFEVLKRKQIEQQEDGKELLGELSPFNTAYFYLDLPKNEKEAKDIFQINKMMGYEAFLTRASLNKPFPTDEQAALSILRIENIDAECISVKIFSIYKQGTACFDIKTQAFSNFIEIPNG